MEQLVRVVKCNDDGTARVVHIRESACSGDCHKCSGCGAAKQTIYLTAHNPIGAKVGDTVTVYSRSASVLAGAALLYLLPLALFIAGYLIGQYLWQTGFWVGGLCFLLGVFLAVAYDRFVAKKKKAEYTITGFGVSGP